jgi:hypothetical protein
MPHHSRCSQADAGCARFRAPIALIIAYSQASLSPGVSFFLFSMGHNNSVYLSAHQDDARTSHFSTVTTTFTLTSTTLTLRGYHLHVVLIDFYSNHNIHAITTLQLRRDVNLSDSTFDLLFSSLTVHGAHAVITGVTTTKIVFIGS